MMKRTLSILGLGVLIGALASRSSAQLSLSLDAPHPSSFSTGPTGSNANLLNVIRTEPLVITLTQAPTLPSPPPGQLLPRRIGLFVGPENPAPMAFPEGLLFLDFFGAVPTIALIDSFSNPGGPTFGPPLSGPSSQVEFTLGANLLGPVFPLPTPTMVIQAVAENTLGFGLQLSNPVRFQLVDPQQAGFPLGITDLLPKAPTPFGNVRPQGLEMGGNVLTITGMNLPAQSNWLQFPPTVRFGGIPSPLVAVLDNNVLACIVPPTAFPTNPPLTAACLVTVEVQANPAISPTGPNVPAPIPYLYLSGLIPSANGFSMATGMPEGGEARALLGQNILDGVQLEFVSAANPSLTTILPATAGAGGLTANYTTPPFCTGDVQVRVRNCDETLSNLVTFTYVPVPPISTVVTPTFTASASLGGQTWAAVNDVASPLSITGTGFLTPTSPLATASTVPAGSFFPTRVFIEGTQETGLVANSTTTVVGNTLSNDQVGLDRPRLGLKELTFLNPPCVNVGNVSPLPSPACPPLTPSCTILRQDVNPPLVTEIYPAIGPVSGCTGIRLRGSNFFARSTGVRDQDFTSFAGPGGVITTIPPEMLLIPAVRFGDRFAPRVRLLSETELEIDVPGVTSVSNLPVSITVFNPDLRGSSTTLNFRYVPSLTDTTRFLEPTIRDLDEEALRILAAGMTLPLNSGSNPPGLQLVVNQSPNTDRGRDPLRNSFQGASYDYVFLFNTRQPTPAGPLPPNFVAAPRVFNFRKINLPATLTLTGPGMARSLPIDPTQSAPGALVPIPAGTTIRVIVKALGFDLTPQGRVEFDPAENHSFVLQAHEAMSIDALLHLGGDCFLPEAYVPSGSGAPGGPFRVRVDRTLPPAGGGRGGRGGAFFPEGLTQLPGPNFGLSPTGLAGGPGESPANRLNPIGLNLITHGRGGVGTAPIGVQSGGGGGGGYVTSGIAGMSGSSPGGAGGMPVGNASTFGALAAMAAPTDDRLIFGAAATDFLLFPAETALGTGLLYGGSGGGGGGGGLAIFVPSVTLGGRGGNGGGCAVLVCNCVLTFGPNAALLTHGEVGQLGVDLFPVYNGDPSIPINLPGAGGGGCGGSIHAFAVSDICFARAPGPQCPLPGGAPAIPGGFITATGGPAGPPQPIAVTVPGGPASVGRMRFSVNMFSPYVANFEASVRALWAANAVVPSPPDLPSLPTNYFTYPSF